jgi:hypothetical protein
MKNRLIPTRWLSVMLTLVCSAALTAADPHEFTSADGSKKLKGTVVSATADAQGKITAEIRRADNNQRLTVPATAFSADDQAYLKEQAAAFAVGRSLDVRLTPKQEKPSKAEEKDGRKISSTDAIYELTCRNNANGPMDGVELKYKVFIKREKRVSAVKGEKKDEVVEGSVDLPAMASRQNHVANTNTIALKSDKPNLGGKG